MVALVDRSTSHFLCRPDFPDQKSAREALSTAYSEVEAHLKAGKALDLAKINEFEQFAGKTRLFLFDQNYRDWGLINSKRSFAYYGHTVTTINPKELFYRNCNDDIHDFLYYKHDSLAHNNSVTRLSNVAQAMKEILKTDDPIVGMSCPPDLKPTPQHSSVYSTVAVAYPVLLLDTFVCSLASRIMTKLLTWRNGQQSDTMASKTILGCRIIISEIAQPIIATVAVVESIVYGFFFLGSRLFRKEESRDSYDTFLKSSSFTIVWSVALFTYYNFSFSPIATQEWQMRAMGAKGPCSPLERKHSVTKLSSKQHSGSQNCMCCVGKMTEKVNKARKSPLGRLVTD